MKSFDHELQKFSQRPPAFSPHEIQQRRAQMRNYRASCVLEGMTAPRINQKLYNFMVEGRISTKEYLDYCKKLYS